MRETTARYSIPFIAMPETREKCGGEFPRARTSGRWNN